MNASKIVALALVAQLAAPSVLAQGDAAVPAVPQDLLDFERRSGNQIVFCINDNSSLVEFDIAVAEVLADSILINAEFVRIIDVDPPLPFDYRFTVNDTELFAVMNNECDVVMGFALPNTGQVPDWLTVTRPYFVTDFVLVTRNEAYQRLADLPEGAVVGTRIGTNADARWRPFTRSNDTWLRRLYTNNGTLMAALSNGEIEGAIIWEPAVHMSVNADPAMIGGSPTPPYWMAALPFDVAPVLFSIGLQPNEQFLRSLLDETIEALVADGTIAELAARFGLPVAEEIQGR